MITGYRAAVDPEKVGVGVTAFILVTQIAGPRGNLEEAFRACHGSRSATTSPVRRA